MRCSFVFNYIALKIIEAICLYLYLQKAVFKKIVYLSRYLYCACCLGAEWLGSSEATRRGGWPTEALYTHLTKESSLRAGWALCHSLKLHFSQTSWIFLSDATPAYPEIITWVYCLIGRLSEAKCGSLARVGSKLWTETKECWLLHIRAERASCALTQPFQLPPGLRDSQDGASVLKSLISRKLHSKLGSWPRNEFWMSNFGE